MSKALIWVLVGFGFFFLLVGVLAPPIAFLGLLMIAGALFLGFRPGGILRKEEVIDTWSVLIENAQGNEERVLKETNDFLRASQAPNLGISRRDLSPGLIRGIMGEQRDFLVVTERTNLRLAPYQIYVNARNYGLNLAVDWCLTFRPTFWMALLSLIPYVSLIPKVVSDLDLFDQQDLRAYVTNAHHCMLKAVDNLMLGLEQDPSKIDRRSRGFLGVSG